MATVPLTALSQLGIALSPLGTMGSLAIKVDTRGMNSMDRSRKANREGNEVTLQHKSQHDATLVEELNDDKLRSLLTFVSHLEQSPPGADELRAPRETLWRVQTNRRRIVRAILRSATALAGPGLSSH